MIADMPPDRIKYYMRLAKHIGEAGNRCYSRQIGTVIVDPVRDKILGVGRNGPSEGMPKCDDYQYLRQVVWPQLTDTEREPHLRVMSPMGKPDYSFADKHHDCGKCPRRLIGAKSGQRTELCSCLHSELSAIQDAACYLGGAWMFAWCGVACWDCAKAIARAKIGQCWFVEDASYSVQGEDYSFGARWLLRTAGVRFRVEKPEFYLEDK